MGKEVKLTKAQLSLLREAVEPYGACVYGEREAGAAQRLKDKDLVSSFGPIQSCHITRIFATPAGRAALEANRE
jgi:hypothetical protein